jgi:hypothetical protein
MALSVLAPGACSKGPREAGGGSAAGAMLGARFGERGGFVGRVKYKVTGSMRELQVEVDRGKPGDRLGVAVAGLELGELRVGIDGKGELKVSAFPDGFADPASGTAVRVGAHELRLEVLEKLADLTAEFGDTTTAVEAGYRAERLGATIVRLLEIEIEGAAGAVVPVSVVGVSLGAVTLDRNGEAALLLCDVGGAPFPTGFPQVGEGAAVKVGDVEGRLVAE